MLAKLLAAVTFLAIAAQSSVAAVAESAPSESSPEAAAPSFRNDVLPVLSKLGCNSGACHGALAGKGGFRLSLRGFDPETDCFNIVKQDRGRRVELTEPGRSLVLAKPTMAIPHKGGLKFEVDSDEYQILSAWIAAGAHAPRADDPRVERIEVAPADSLFSIGEERPLAVTAYFSDGTERDVTRWTKWSSTNAAVCDVDEGGRVTVAGPGVSAVVAWYSSKIAIGRIAVPYPSVEVAADQIDQREPRNFIDEAIDAQLTRLNLPAAPACGDAEFVRRAYIDAIGLPPTAAEVRAFLVDASEDKRDRLIDALLEREEFIDYWTYHWSDVFLLSGTKLRPAAIKAYYQWIREHVAADTPWDVMVREVLTATGDSHVDGETNFYALFQSPEDVSENAAQAFLGLSIGCAKCHNHPLEKWTNDQYYAMANLFARVRAKGWGGDPRGGDGRRTLYVAETGELVQPRTGRPQPPTPLDGEPLPFDDPGDRREHLAAAMTSPDNPYFTRAIANRVWARFFSVGLVESVDDLRVSNPASNEELLSAAADFLIEHEYRLKPLMRAIMQSNAYQRSSIPAPGAEGETRFYSRYYPRRMQAEVLHDAVVQGTGVPTTFDKIAFPGSDVENTDFYPVGTRAVELYDSAVESYFLTKFGRNDRSIICECNRSDEPSIVQVLHITNGTTINEKLQATNGRVSELLRLRAAGASDAAILDEIYLACLARYPTESERESLLEDFPSVGSEDERIYLEDLFWAVLSSREFLFNH